MSEIVDAERKSRLERAIRRITGPARESNAGLDVAKVIESLSTWSAEIRQPNGLLNAGSPRRISFTLFYDAGRTTPKQWRASITMFNQEGKVKRKVACAPDAQRAVRDAAGAFVKEYGTDGRDGSYRPQKDFD